MSKAYHPPAKAGRPAPLRQAPATAAALGALLPTIDALVISFPDEAAILPAIQTFHARLRTVFSAIGQDAIHYALQEGRCRGAFATDAAAARFAITCLLQWEASLQAGYAAGEAPPADPPPAAS